MNLASALAVLSLGAVASGCGADSKSSRAQDASHNHEGQDVGGNAGQAMTAGGKANAGGIGGGSAVSDGDGKGETGNAAESDGAGAPAGGRATAASGGSGAGELARGGAAGALARSGGASGTSGSAGETTGNAGNGDGAAPDCRNLCSTGAPACCTTELRCVTSAEPHCRIDVLAEKIDLPHDYDALEQELLQLSGDLFLSITDGDVKSAAAAAPVAARFEFDLNERASKDYGELLEDAFGRPFRVSCDDQPLFDGIFWFKEGQAALDAPVMSVEQATDGGAVLELGAFAGAWSLASENGGTDADRERIDRPELRAPFCSRGILGVLD